MSEPLGPALMPEFAEAVGLENLVGRSKGPRPVVRGTDGAATSPSQPAPAQASPASQGAPSAPPIPPELLRKLVVQFDGTVAAITKTSPEDPKMMEQLADVAHPLVAYYSQGTTSVAALWIVAGLAFLGYLAAKGIKISEARRTEKARRRAHNEGETTTSERPWKPGDPVATGPGER